MIFGSWFTQTTYLTLAAAVVAVIFAVWGRWPQTTMTVLLIAGLSLVIAAPIFLMRPAEERKHAGFLDQFNVKGKVALSLGAVMILVVLAETYR